MRTRSLYAPFFLLLITLLISVSSCRKAIMDSVQPAVDETENTLTHDEWSKVTFRFHEGHLHGVNFHGNPNNISLQHFKTVQEISYEMNEMGNVVPSTKDSILFVEGYYYALEIIYYNKKGERMNAQFTTPEMRRIHQHFFRIYDKQCIKSGQRSTDTAGMMSYTYRDTDPENARVGSGSTKLTNDPLGLKGYFHITGGYGYFYHLNVTLVHVIRGAKFDDKGMPYPFNKPSSRVLGTTDLSLNLPIKVFAKHPMTDEEFEEGHPVNDIMKQFGITEEEVDKLIEQKTGEGSAYWM